MEALAAGNGLGGAGSIDDLLMDSGAAGPTHEGMTSPSLASQASGPSAAYGFGNSRMGLVGPGIRSFSSPDEDGSEGSDKSDDDLRSRTSRLGAMVFSSPGMQSVSAASLGPGSSIGPAPEESVPSQSAPDRDIASSSQRQTQATRTPQKSIYETVFGPAFKQLKIQPVPPAEPAAGPSSSSRAQQKQPATEPRQPPRRKSLQGYSGAADASFAAPDSRIVSMPHSTSVPAGTSTWLNRAASNPQLGSPTRKDGPRFDPHNHPTVEQRNHELALAFPQPPSPSPGRQRRHAQAASPTASPSSAAMRQVYADDRTVNHRAITGSITPGASPRNKRARLPSNNYAGLGITTPPSGSSPAKSNGKGANKTGANGFGSGANGAHQDDPLAFLPNGHPASSLAQDLGITQGGSRSRTTSVNGWRTQEYSNSRGGGPADHSPEAVSARTRDEQAEQQKMANLLAAISQERGSGNASTSGTTPPRNEPQKVNGFAHPQTLTPRRQASALRQLHSPVPGSRKALHTMQSPMTHHSASLSARQSEQTQHVRRASQQDEGEAAELMLLLATSPSPATDQKRSRFAGATPSLGGPMHRREDSSGLARSLFSGDARFSREEPPRTKSQEPPSLGEPVLISSESSADTSAASTQDDHSARTSATSVEGEKDTPESETIALPKQGADERLTPPKTPPSTRLPAAPFGEDRSQALHSDQVPLPTTPPGAAPRTPKAPGTNFSYADFLNVSPSPQPRSRRTPRMRGVSANGVFDPFPTEFTGTPSRHDKGRFEVHHHQVLTRGPLTFDEPELLGHLDGDPHDRQRVHNLHGFLDAQAAQTGESPTKRARLAFQQ